MKRFITVILAAMIFMTSFSAVAQDFHVTNDGKMYTTMVVENTGLSVEEAYMACEEFFNTTYTVTTITRQQISRPGTLMYRSSFGRLTLFNMYWQLVDEHIVKVYIKPNRIKIEICSPVVNLISSKGPTDYDGLKLWSDLYPINENMKVKDTNITQDAAERAYNKWIELSKFMLIKFENYIRNEANANHSW